MANRGHIPSESERPRIQAPGGAEENTAAQAAEIERLVAKNQRLLASHASLRQEILATRQEMQRLQAHAARAQTEGDILIRELMENIRKTEAEIRDGEIVKRELQQAYLEGHSLVAKKQELIIEIQRVTEELEKAYTDIGNLPEIHAELDGLRQDYQRIRADFEYEKGLNTEQVNQLKEMEKYLISMAREAEKLRAKLANAPNPYGGIYGFEAPSGQGDAECSHGQGGGHAAGVKGCGGNPGAGLGHGGPASCYEVHGMAQGQATSGIGGGGLNARIGKSVAGYSGGHGWMPDLITGAAAAAEEETNPHDGIGGVSNEKAEGTP